MSKEQKLNYTQYIKAKKSQVEDTELNARYQKARWETMYYTIENERITSEYAAVLEKIKPVLEEQAKDFPLPPEEVSLGVDLKQEEVDSAN